MANLLSNVLPRWPVAALCLPETFKVIPWELSRPKNSTYCIRCIEVEDYANSGTYIPRALHHTKICNSTQYTVPRQDVRARSVYHLEDKNDSFCA